MKELHRISGALLLCAWLPACKETEQQRGPMPQPSKAAPAGFEVDTGKALALTAEDTPSSASLAQVKAGPEASAIRLPAELVSALEATLPVIEEARILEALQAIPQSRMARLVVCMEQGVEPSTSQILRAYRTASWQEITVHTPPHDENRRSFTAVSDGFRLSGSAYQGAFKDCDKAKDFTRVSFSFHERQDAGALVPTPALSDRDAAKKSATLASPHVLLRGARSKDAR